MFIRGIHGKSIKPRELTAAYAIESFKFLIDTLLNNLSHLIQSIGYR